MSQLEVDKIIPQSGTTLTIGDSGDTITFADGAVIGIDTNTLYIDSANNRVGVGTTSPDTLLHISQSGGAILRLENPDGIVSDNEIIGKIEFEHQDSGGAGVSAFINAFANGINGAGNISFGTGAPGGNASEVMRITSQGLLGIGTTSPSKRLHSVVSSSGSLETALALQNSNAVDGTETALDFSSNTSFVATARISSARDGAGLHSLRFSTYNLGLSEAMRINSAGNVSIGKTSSAGKSLELYASTNTAMRIQNSTTGTGSGDGLLIEMGGSDALIYNYENGVMKFGTNNAERMRIDSSGNVLVGKTSDSFADVGVVLSDSQANSFTRNGANVISVRRNTSDGDIVSFYKDTTKVGSISTFNTHIGIAQGNTRLEIDDGSDAIFFTTNNDGSLRDNTTDLGKSNARLDDIYATNGTIQTSDQNEKQSIQSLTTSEIAVAKRISKLFKTFKFNSSVEEKGDSARTHTGIIAQDVQQAFADEGLDASNYALFISGTWWEKEISVDAVAEELDEEGNVIVEGKEAYTYMDTKEEATEGYTQRTRLGIRYPELLSFVSSAFEQRLTDIETRLTALET